MNTCNRCGSPVPAGLVSCQRCGMPLSDVMHGGAGPSMAPRMAAPEQPELPAWLETLRAGERPGPASTTNNQANFSASDLVDDNTVPGWMRPEGIESGNSSKHPAVRPATMSAPNTDGGFLSRGMAASSLIDEQALPAWLHGQQTVPPHARQDNIAAASLIQPEAVPPWMKAVQPAAPAPAASHPTQYVQPGMPLQGMAGKEFIDEQSIPAWMSNANGKNVSSGNGQADLGGSSFLDMRALPPWLREPEQQEQPRVEAQAIPPNQPAQPFSQPVQAPNMNSNLVAASLIDMEALPDWLRPAGEQQQYGTPSLQGEGSAENARQGSMNVHARVENVRVPSRPRSEMGPHEESEVAANVFASMLGVASVAPYTPGQESVPQQSMPQMSYGGMLNTPSVSMAGAPQEFLTPAPGNVGSPTSQGYVQGGYQGNYAMTNMAGTPQQPANIYGMQPGQPVNSQAKQNTRKRGFFEAIRDFIFRS